MDSVCFNVDACRFTLLCGGYYADRLRSGGRASAVISYLRANTFAVYLFRMFVRPSIAALVQSVQPVWMETVVNVLLAISLVIFLAVIGSLLHRTKIGDWLLSVWGRLRCPNESLLADRL